MKRISGFWALLLCLAWAQNALAEDARPQEASPAAAAPASSDAGSPASVLPQDLEKHGIFEGGFVWGAEFEQWALDNGRPLSYAPLQIGWEFKQGFRIIGGLSAYFYEGEQVDGQNPGLGARRYTYQVTDWRLEAQWLPLRGWLLRPTLGLGADLVGGERRLAPAIIGGVDLNASAPRETLTGFLGASAAAGVEADFGGAWRLQARARAIAAFGSSSSLPWTLGLGLYRVF